MGSRHVRRAATLAALGALLLANLAIVPARAIAFTFNVNSEADAPDADITNPACLTLIGECTLRAAVMQANWLDDEGSHHVINVPAGTYVLSIENTAGDENGATKGDLDLWQDTHIVGAGSSRTFVQASPTGPGTGIDRVFELADDPIAVTISGMTIRYGNSGGESGGGISIQTINQDLRLESVVVERNTSTNSGPAISVFDGSLTIVDSVIRSNEGRNSTIEVDGGSLTIRRSTIAGNETKLNASAFRLTNNSTGSIERSTISGNTSITGGPVLVAGGSSLLFRNVTLASNTGPGAMLATLFDGSVEVRSATIAGNTGIGLDIGGSSDVRNTILAGNSAGNCASAPTSIGSNLDTGETCGFDGAGDISTGLPKLGPLQDNGGPTRTRALTKGSDAIDAGSSCIDVDQRGESRPKDGDGDGEAVCDIGAFEAPAVAVASPSAGASDAPSAAPSEPPASTEPGSSAPASSGEPLATEPGGTAAPASAGTGPTPAPSIEPIPAGEEFIRGPIPWIMISALALLTFLGIVIGLRRRDRDEGV